MILGRFFYKHLCNFHSSIKQCCAQSPVNTILWYFQLLSAEVSCNYHQIVSTEDRAKLYFKNEWTLVSTWVRNFWLPFKKEMCFNDPGDISLLHTFVKKGSMYLNWSQNIIGIQVNLFQSLISISPRYNIFIPQL